MIPKTFDLPLLSLLSLVALVPANGATVFTSVADTYINGITGNTTTNFGGDPTMVTNLRTADTRISVVQFDFSSMSGTISAAKLELEMTNTAPTLTYQVWGLLEAHDDFVETSLTYSNAGFRSGTTVDVSKAYTGAVLGTFTATGVGVKTAFDVTSGNYINFLNADLDKKVTFVITETDTGVTGAAFATKEHATALKPTLTLVPEPGAVSLLCLGGMLLVRRRR